MDDVMGMLMKKYQELEECRQDIVRAYELLKESFRQDGKLLICGNGGSASDSEHIVGELMKGFMSRRVLSAEEQGLFARAFPEEGAYLSGHLQGALPAISLASPSALLTAYSNDVAPDMMFAQQVYGYGRPGDTLLGLTTSGNSPNVIRALQVAKVKGVQTIGLTGKTGGRMKELCDVTIRVPSDSTPVVQEWHLPIYHALCMMLEKEFFSV
ncbi:D-sedoheptulose-7-phosphate isomerase [Paenibacillus sacheonensis]|uniref:SIS domain-containing protein n=1 Tax=Paenibacillus sacheonensis TaxID=742054 RepID=A0A7X5BXH7_9BACL|nr:SIS domain-containing protein [Paenibacillus sacheonensis]MBM7568745.1 D-sedoheptulose 7-phosphate isomerase [Paenibacillus sacheonensis]NBC68416.1 SIS domain-containing protein [Paenibacillus sacheonensis]